MEAERLQAAADTTQSGTNSFDLHVQDTIRAGDGLCNEEAVKIMVREGPRLIRKLSELGIEFVKNGSGTFDLGREGGHSRRRIVHAKDTTGKEVESTLIRKVKGKSTIKVFENHFALDLIICVAPHTSRRASSLDAAHEQNKTCVGAWILDARNNIWPFISKATLLATGGIGQVYLHTTNPSIATGDGIAMARRAQAKIANMEFVQFHPTSFYGKKIDDRAFLLSEATRGEGGILRTRDGKPFMEKYHPLKDLAPRDIVARAIDQELKKRGDKYVYLDLTGLGAAKLKSRFPHIYETCLSFGIDVTKEWIPVVPAAHYICGGVLTDVEGRTSISNLYAAGEVACTGVHGANRLASNSLLEALVFAERAAISAAQHSSNKQDGVRGFPTDRCTASCGMVSLTEIPSFEHKGKDFIEPREIAHKRYEIQKLMWDYVGIVRSERRLLQALKRMKVLKDDVDKTYERCKVTPALVELRNIAEVAILVIKSSIMRKESRGLYYNAEYPHKDDENFKKYTMINSD
ncbi:MAG TPA: L-aspartate oxidase [bacterium (Candidatus Stahlbacteria)]|nr:L-aspartate oxidase [Candidatus Stahlbacteria bacterium]